MTVSNPTENFTIYIYEESKIVRTGLLLYYDPLAMADINGELLSTLNARDDTLPSTDPAGPSFPNDINANNLTLTV